MKLGFCDPSAAFPGLKLSVMTIVHPLRTRSLYKAATMALPSGTLATDDPISIGAPLFQAPEGRRGFKDSAVGPRIEST